MPKIDILTITSTEGKAKVSKSLMLKCFARGFVFKGFVCGVFVEFIFLESLLIKPLLVFYKRIIQKQSLS